MTQQLSSLTPIWPPTFVRIHGKAGRLGQSSRLFFNYLTEFGIFGNVKLRKVGII